LVAFATTNLAHMTLLHSELSGGKRKDVSDHAPYFLSDPNAPNSPNDFIPFNRLYYTVHGVNGGEPGHDHRVAIQ